MDTQTILRVGALTVAVALLAGSSMGCGSAPKTTTEECMTVTKSEFYKDGTFDAEKAKQAYFELMKKLGAPCYPRYVEEPGFLWAVDFAQGDFERFGMGGVFWANDREKQYFAHEIFLLPGQSIAEHRHVKTVDDKGDLQPKHERWQVRYGSVYGFSEVGEPNLDQYPEVKALLAKCQVPHMHSVHVEKWEADGQVHSLAEIETWHFMMGGPEGAVVSEYATYHDGNGLRFSCPNVAF